MKLIQSNQKNVAFVFCSSPITIDKSDSWGAGNLQQAPNGAYLKMSSATEISHLVQPNADMTAPIGWVPGSAPGLFNKAPIWVDDQHVLQPGDRKELMTADGPIDYEVREPSMVCYNDQNGAPNLDDAWVQKLSDIKKNYVLEATPAPKRGLVARIFGAKAA